MYWQELTASYEYPKHEVVYKISPACHLRQSSRREPNAMRPGSLPSARLKDGEAALAKPLTSLGK